VDGPTGLISGTTVAIGTYYVVLAATNANGVGHLSITITVS
jgi:PKD repeat protein